MIQYDQPMPLVQLFCLVLYKDKNILLQVKKKLEETFSSICFEGNSHLFTATTYYHKEMGEPLYRLLIGFNGLYETRILAKAKLLCNQIESSFCSQENRQINLDIGYLDFFKIILASFKYRSNKLYLGNAIWGDWQLYFHEGKYQPFAWSFPDMPLPTLQQEWLDLRALFKTQTKQNKNAIIL